MNEQRHLFDATCARTMLEQYDDAEAWLVSDHPGPTGDRCAGHCDRCLRARAVQSSTWREWRGFARAAALEYRDAVDAFLADACAGEARHAAALRSLHHMLTRTMR